MQLPGRRYSRQREQPTQAPSALRWEHLASGLYSSKDGMGRGGAGMGRGGAGLGHSEQRGKK